jgi:predicted Zn finger-like uncharacterized protein
MKFVCDRCQTRYSIADEKVRQKILRIRCKTCGNVIVVQDEAAHGPGEAKPHAHEAAKPAEAGAPRSPSASGPKAAPASGPKAAPPSASRAGKSGPPPLPRAAKGADRLGGHAEWYVAVDGVQSGPFSRKEAARRIAAAGPDQDTHVWKEGMAAWKTPREVSVIARELSQLRAAPPQPRPASSAPPAASPIASPAKPAASPKSTTPPPASQGAPPRSPPAAAAAAGPIGAAVDDLFGDITTQKSTGLRELVAESADVDFGEVTTKKGKNLRDLETDPLHAPSSNLPDAEATPPPVEPLPPVGGKVASRTPAAPSFPVAHRAVPPFVAPPALAHAPVPAFVASPALARAPVPPFVAPPAAPAHAPPPFVAPSAAPAPFAAPAVVATPPPFVVPTSPMSIPGTPLPPPAAASSSGQAPALGEPLGLTPLPTPEPLPVPPLGVPPQVMSSDFAMVPSLRAGLFQRQPGLKYVVAAAAIVVLVILLGMVILRDSGKQEEPAVVAGSEPAKPEPAKPEPAKPELAKVEEPKVAKPPPAEIPSPPPPVEAKAAGGATRHGGRRSGRTGVAAPERPPKPEPKPPRLAGARPNPFDDVKGVSQAQITAVVRNPANQAGLKSCYERALKMDNHLTSGRIDVTVSVTSSGSVQRVVVNAPSSFIMVEPCIKGAVKRWRFPSNTEDYATNFPLIMQGGM